MNNKELRLGNILMSDNYYWIVIAIGQGHKGFEVKPYPAKDDTPSIPDHIDPVPLSKNIFLAVGAVATGNNSYELLTDKRRFLFKPYNNICYHAMQLHDQIYLHVATICFLHQLQNLVSILTGEEIQFNTDSHANE